MLSLLLCVDIIFFIVFFSGLPFSTYRILISVWSELFLNLMRMLLIGTLFFDYKDLGNPLIETIQVGLIIGMIGLYIIVTTIVVLSAIQ